ncbi:AAA family ATPase [Microvirga terrestris]|uniref:ATP-binding protein n=1 Tax=Microvirga terrestris TaxID=2791024 RepID=A0ABS0HM47_9HYPH|nr:ATP-binding protein [Microvirga terrestris]MBF9194439.1 ATP-binding protein [Microvirga terrestris]
MLMRFGAANFGSLRTSQEISLVASSLKDKGSHLIEVPEQKQSLLSSAILYGANASGKTTMLKAFYAMHNMLLHSHNRSSPTGGIQRNKFALDPEMKDNVSQFDCDVIIDGVRYHYGFKLNDEEFLEEWLYAFPGGSRQSWFYRKKGEPINFGKNLKGQNKSTEALTRPNSLFLSAAAQNAHSQLTSIYSYFQKRFFFDLTPNPNPVMLPFLFAKNDFDRRILSILNMADTGIVDVKLERKQGSEKQKMMLSGLVDVISNVFPDIGPSAQEIDNIFPELRFAHSAKSGEKVFLDLDTESRGTIRLVELLGPCLRALDTGGILFVDEIDTSLHTGLASAVIELFSSNVSNPKGAQLIATTHDTNLLCSGALRRDQIWFVEKDSSGESSAYPLSDLKTRNTDNFEKGYLEGRFGAVPFTGNIQKLFMEEAA